LKKRKLCQWGRKHCRKLTLIQCVLEDLMTNNWALWSVEAFSHRFDMELDLQSLFGLHVYTAVPEIIDQVFAKTSQKRLFSMTEYERFGLVFTKTRVYKSGTVLSDCDLATPPRIWAHIRGRPKLR
jgi:hypothetical protein